MEQVTPQDAAIEFQQGVMAFANGEDVESEHGEEFTMIIQACGQMMLTYVALRVRSNQQPNLGVQGFYPNGSAE